MQQPWCIWRSGTKKKSHCFSGKTYFWCTCEILKMASQLFICLSFVCFFFKSPIFDSLWKHRACTPVALGIGYVDFTGMTGVFFFPYANQLTVVLIQGLSVCDNCTWILNGLQGRTWFVTIFMHVFSCLDLWWYVKTVKRLVLYQQVLLFNSRCAVPWLAI